MKLSAIVRCAFSIYSYILIRHFYFRKGALQSFFLSVVHPLVGVQKNYHFILQAFKKIIVQSECQCSGFRYLLHKHKQQKMITKGENYILRVQESLSITEEQTSIIMLRSNVVSIRSVQIGICYNFEIVEKNFWLHSHNIAVPNQRISQKKLVT